MPIDTEYELDGDTTRWFREHVTDDIALQMIHVCLRRAYMQGRLVQLEANIENNDALFKNLRAIRI